MSAEYETSVRAFNAAFTQYRAVNRRAPGELLEVRGRRLRYALWKEFKAIAKTAASLRSEFAALGYAVKRRPDPDLAAAFPGAAKVGAVPKISAERELKLRGKSLKFLSVSFLHKSWKTKGAGQNARFDARSRANQRIGEAIVRTAPSNENPFVAVASFLEGVIAQDRDRRIAAKVLRAEAGDMHTYLARKHREAQAKLFRRTYDAKVTLA